MAVRLQMKLGLVAEADHLPDSTDTVVVVEPNIGSTARTKGSLYLLVTGMTGRKVREATRIVAETIRAEYYYDESAGIAVCLMKAIRAANKRLLHSGDRYTKRGEAPPVGLAIAVVRGNEAYVLTLGPAEAYLVRQARLLTLPEADPNGGLPNDELGEPEVWHGEIVVGDCLVLVSPNVTRKLGLSPIQESVVQLHPQGAVEQLHRQFVSGGGAGSDGIVAIESTEVAATHKSRPLKPVWPNDALAGTPEHSPIPLADTVVDGVAAVQSSARHVQHSAGGIVRRSFYRLLELMPRRQPRRTRVTSLPRRYERQRRMAAAVIGLLIVLGLMGGGVYMLAGANTGDKLDTQKKGQQAYSRIEDDLDQVFGHGRDLITSDKQRAGELLKDAYSNLDTAAKNGYTEEVLQPLRTQITEGLNRYFNVVYIAPKSIAAFGSDELGAVVLGPDGAAYVLDQSTSAVYRVDLANGTKKAVATKGDPAPGGVVGIPRLLAVGGPDVLILDDKNAVWRWRPIVQGDSAGRGTLIKIRVDEASSWGSNVRALGTYVTNADVGLYALYVVDPAAQQILKYSAAADGSGYPFTANKYLTVSQPVADVDDMIIDGSLYLAERGQIDRFDGGQSMKGWSAHSPGDSMLRPQAAAYTRIATATAQGVGDIYAYDGVNRRVVAFRKDSGEFVEQYMVTASSSRLSALRGMFVVTGPNDDNPILYWIESGDLMSASLNPSAPLPVATPSPTASPKPSATPTPKPKPSPTKRRH